MGDMFNERRGAAIVKHLTERLEARMAATEADVRGRKSRRSVVCTSDTLFCFTSTGRSGKTTKFHNYTQIYSMFSLFVCFVFGLG